MFYLHLILRAIEPDTNVNRMYEIRRDKGLFESWLVIIAYGAYSSLIRWGSFNHIPLKTNTIEPYHGFELRLKTS